MPQLLTHDEIETVLAAHPDWRVSADGLAFERDYSFKGFAAAFGFMAQVALASERHNHHPEWSNVYNRVTIRWTTHASGGLTELDRKLVEKIDRFAND